MELSAPDSETPSVRSSRVLAGELAEMEFSLVSFGIRYPSDEEKKGLDSQAWMR